MFKFEVLHKSTKSRARVGKIHTPHGIIDTPGFVAVGTNGTIKSLDSKTVSELGLQLMFCNTYHLLLQPGPDVIQEAGGLHNFSGRNLPLITDSGGFQVFSLLYGSVASELKSCGKKSDSASVLKINEEGVTFRSYRDGKKILLTPESSIQTQKALGADIIIPLDELPPYHKEKRYLEDSLARTHRWELRSLAEHRKQINNQAMYAVIHGGVHLDLRKQSCDLLSSHPFDGFAIGGSMGKTREEMVHMLSNTMEWIPKDFPTHLLGIADLQSLDRCVPFGLDTFDSSYPTKAARHGTLFTKNGTVSIRKSAYSRYFGPIDETCSCPTCQHYNAAYLHHLFKAKELTYYTLSTVHNLYFMVQLMSSIRQKIYDNEI